MNALAYVRTLCMYVRTYVRTYVCMYVCMYIRTYVHTYIRTYVHTYIRTYVHTYIRTYVHTYVYYPVSVRVYISVYTYHSVSINIYIFDTFLYSSCLAADPLKEVACTHQEIPSLGSYGHPSICRRPCILFIRGTCKKAADCGFCHLRHVTLQDLSKLPLVCFFGNPFLLIRKNFCTVQPL